MYEYEFTKPIRISNAETITQIKGKLLIKYNDQKKPRDWKSQIEMKQADENNPGRFQNLTFRSVRSQVNADNTFSCAFQENPLTALNEFDNQNQRKLSISITGSLNNTEVNGVMAWNEISGRPANVSLKMTIKKSE